MDDPARTRGSHRVPLLAGCAFTLFGWVFLAGEAMSDPGGAKGIGLIAAVTAPIVALSALAWLRPAPAATALTALSALMICVALWFAVDPGSWRSFENGHGPVRAIGVFVLLLPLAVLGRHRPRLAGWNLIAIAMLPVLMTVAGERGGSSSMRASALPAMVVGVLWLLAAASGSARRAARAPT